MATVMIEPSLEETTEIVPFEMTVDFYAKLVDSGLLPEHQRLFLLEGKLFEKMAKSKAHGYVGAGLNKAVVRRLPEGWSLWPESTIVLNNKNAPLPDFSIVRGANPLDYGHPDRYPNVSDIGILIEIAVSSLRFDLTTALELYARCGVPVYWVVDVAGRRILVHSCPQVIENRGVYTQVEIYQPGQEVPVELDGKTVAAVPVDELLR